MTNFYPFFATFSFIMGAAVEKNDLVYFRRKKCDIVKYGQTNEGEVGVMGSQLGGGTGHNISMANHDENLPIKQKVKSGQYVTVEVFKDGRVVHDQMEFGVFLPKATYLIFLEKRLLSKGKMYVVLPKMVTKWRDGEEPTDEDRLNLPLTSTKVGDFLRKHV